MAINSQTSVVALSKYIEAATSQYHACFDCHKKERIDEIKTSIRFQYLKFNNNGQPKFDELAEVLANHIIEYCLSAKRRGSPQSPRDYSPLNRQARAYLRMTKTSGEVGELLLYFLMEAILKAPQIVAKMELKTNPKMENHGSDGVHMKWNKKDKLLDIYFGEAKLEQDIYSALDNMKESILNFHSADLKKHEFGLVTTHFKIADEETKAAVLRLMNEKEPTGNCRINHACLLGYNWDFYKKLNDVALSKLITTFRSQYESDIPRIKELLIKRFNCLPKHLYFKVFVLPFKNVQDFRDEFYRVV